MAKLPSPPAEPGQAGRGGVVDLEPSGPYGRAGMGLQQSHHINHTMAGQRYAPLEPHIANGHRQPNQPNIANRYPPLEPAPLAPSGPVRVLEPP
jgi:hypothetical protein